jgi:hypothetical protein
LVARPAIPPFLILLEEDGRIDDVVMIIHVVEKALDKSVHLGASRQNIECMLELRTGTGMNPS